MTEYEEQGLHERIRWIGLLGALLALAVMSCTLSLGTEIEGFPCNDDGTCQHGLICVDDICVLDPCGEIDCEENEVCLQGACYSRDCANHSCPRDLICLDGQCVAPDCAGVSCEPGHACAEGQCYPTGCATMDCGLGICLDGRCIPRSCIDVECSEGYRCALGECYPEDCEEPCSQEEVCVDGECVSLYCVGVSCPDGTPCSGGFCGFSVRTVSALDVRGTSARLKGELASLGESEAANVWFVYGTTEMLEGGVVGFQANMNEAGVFNHTLDGLMTDRTYFFQAQGSSSTGDESQGAIKQFTTEGIVDFVLTISLDEGGRTDPAEGVHNYEEGEQIDITAIADPNYIFIGWSGDCSGTDECQLEMTSDKSVHAGFELQEWDLTISSDEGGTTTPVEGIHHYEHGESVAVTASASEGYEFIGWSGDCLGHEECELTMTSDKSVHAGFELERYNLTITSEGEGTTVPPEGVHIYPRGESVTIEALPDHGHEFVGWSDDCSGTGSCELLMTSDKRATANFWDRYLYRNGDEYELMTGGWTLTHAGFGTEKRHDHFYCRTEGTGVDSGFVMTNTVDFSGVSTIYVDWSSEGNNSVNHRNHLVLRDETTQVVTFLTSTNHPRRVDSFDVSSYNGEYRVEVRARITGNGSGEQITRVWRVWLE